MLDMIFALSPPIPDQEKNQLVAFYVYYISLSRII